MKLREMEDIQIKDREWLKITDLENIFDVHIDKNGNYFYNINNSLYINVDENILNEYICSCSMHWPLISYKIYSTTRLAWLLMKLNNVECKDIFKKKEAGDKIKYLPKEYATNIVENINNFI